MLSTCLDYIVVIKQTTVRHTSEEQGRSLGSGHREGVSQFSPERRKWRCAGRRVNYFTPNYLNTVKI